AVQEIRSWGKSKWAVAVMPLVTKDVPADHPSLEPIWNECVAHDLPVAHHSFTWTPPYFPGVFDLWDNIFLGRLASHPWGAMRFIASVIGGGIMDRHPELRVGLLECGFGWLPFWGRRMNEQYEYVGSCAKLEHHPEDYLKSVRLFFSIERHEGEYMFAGCDRIVAGAGAGRLLAGFVGLHRFAQQLARLDDRLVGRAEMLAAAIDDRAHAFLQGTVLLVDAVDAGVALGLLHLAVETVIVRPVLQRTEGLLVDMQGTVAEAAFEPVFVAQRRIGGAVDPV